MKKIHTQKWFKISACCGLAFLTALVLFYFMSALISNTADLEKKQGSGGLVEFIRVKPKDFLDEKKRKLPQKKPKEQKPPRLKMPDSALAKPKKPQLNMKVPNIKSLLKSDGPAVGGVGGVGIGSALTPLVRIEPQYPRKAAMQGIEGYVRLQFDITPAGTVSGVEVLDSRPPKVFDRAAVKALRKWKYRPKIENGKPVEQKGERVQLDFKLE